MGTKLLLNSYPLIVIPELATRIGLNEAIILQQIHYWIEINKKANKNFKDNEYWVFNSLEGWHSQFPFWGRNTIQRTIKRLESMKLLAIGNYNKLKIDRTKWYRINYKVLECLEQSPFAQIGATNIPNWVNHITKMGIPLPETNPEINPKNKVYISELMDVYLEKYEKVKGVPHRNLKTGVDFGCLEGMDSQDFGEVVHDYLLENPIDRCNMEYFASIVERYK